LFVDNLKQKLKCVHKTSLAFIKLQDMGSLASGGIWGQNYAGQNKIKKLKVVVCVLKSV
jgi:hypothetical protein